MAVTFTVGTTGYENSGGGATSVLASAYTPTGSDRYIVGSILDASTGTGSHTEFRDNTSGGNTLTQVSATTSDFGDGFIGSIFSTWDDVAPPASSSQPYALISSARDYFGITAAAFDGVDQTTPRDNYATAVQGSGDNDLAEPTSITVTGLSSGDMVVMVAAAKSLGATVPSINVASGGTWSVASGTNLSLTDRQARVLIGTQIASGASATFNVEITSTTSSDYRSWELRAWRVRAAAGGSGISTAWITA